MVDTPLKLGPVPLVEKDDWVLARVAGRRVLHAGPTDSPLTRVKAQGGRLLHQKLRAAGVDVVGVDLDAAAIAELRAGYGIDDILHGNVEELGDLVPPHSFDVVLAGDVVEHINNVGRFLDAARAALRPGGELIVTVPNAFAIKRMLGVALLRQERNHPDHMYYFSLMTLHQAMERFGYEVEEVCTFIYRDEARRVNRLANVVVGAATRVFRNNHLADEYAIRARVR